MTSDWGVTDVLIYENSGQLDEIAIDDRSRVRFDERRFRIDRGGLLHIFKFQREVEPGELPHVELHARLPRRLETRGLYFDRVHPRRQRRRHVNAFRGCRDTLLRISLPMT